MNRLILLLLLLFVTATPMTLQANTPPVSYPVQLTATGGGKITPEREKLNHGAKNVKFRIKPDKGRIIDLVVLNGTSLGRVPVVTIPVVEGPVSIIAFFKSGIPTVDAGNSVTTFVNKPVTLQPAVTPALPEDSLEYEWKVHKKSGKGKVSFSDRHVKTPTFVATQPGYYELQLQVTEGKYKNFDTVTVQVISSPEDNPPVAVPTAPATVFVGQQVNLSGSSSHDPSNLPLSYNWQMVAAPQGSTATLTDATTVYPKFTVDLPGTYIVMLTVANDYAASEPRVVQILAKQNAMPVADAGPDQSVFPGATVILDGSASHDADGDTLTFTWSFQSCPQNNCPYLIDSYSAKPSFVAGLEGSYSLSLTVNDGKAPSVTDTVLIVAASAPPENPDYMKLQWQYGVFGTYIGESGLHVVDLDGDGSTEIVASASAGGFGFNSMWYVLRRAADGNYEQVWRSEAYASPIVRLLVADVTADGKVDVVVGHSDGTIRIVDGPTHAEVGLLATAGNLADMAIADVNGDGAPEIVTTNGTGVFVYNAVGGAPQWSLSTAGGDSLAVGNVDKDASLEIITTTNGGTGYVIDTVSHAIEWEYVNGFGHRVGLGDLDGDGMQEIVGAAGWYKITVFDADVKTPVWEIAPDLDVSALLVVDVNDDGRPDILYGDGQWGSVYAIDGLTRQQIWSISNPDAGVQGLAFGDADQDGKMEILWSGGGSSTGADHLYIADPQTGSVEWKSMHVDGPLSPLDVGDVDGDGDDEIVMVSWGSDSGYGEGVIHIFDAKTHSLEYREKLGLMDWMGVRSVRIDDVDVDGKNELVVTTANIYAGIIRVYDGATRVVKYESAGYNGNYFSALAIADVDNDGKKEIVAGQGKEHTGAQGTYLIVFDGATLQEKWRSVDLGTNWGYVHDIKIADIDGDGNQEIIAALGSQLLVYDGVTHILKFLGNQSAISLAVNTDKEILVGREDGKVDVIDGVSFSVKKTVPTASNSPVDALRAVDLTGDGVPEWLVAHSGKLEIMEGDPQTLKWVSPNLAPNLGLFNHLVVRDTDGDGLQELFIGDNVGVYHFEQKP